MDIQTKESKLTNNHRNRHHLTASLSSSEIDLALIFSKKGALGKMDLKTQMMKKSKNLDKVDNKLHRLNRHTVDTGTQNGRIQTMIQMMKMPRANKDSLPHKIYSQISRGR